MKYNSKLQQIDPGMYGGYNTPEAVTSENHSFYGAPTSGFTFPKHFVKSEHAGMEMKQYPQPSAGTLATQQ